MSAFATSFPRVHGLCRPYLGTIMASCHLQGVLATASVFGGLGMYLFDFFTVVPAHIAARGTDIQRTGGNNATTRPTIRSGIFDTDIRENPSPLLGLLSASPLARFPVV